MLSDDVGANVNTANLELTEEQMLVRLKGILKKHIQLYQKEDNPDLDEKYKIPNVKETKPNFIAIQLEKFSIFCSGSGKYGRARASDYLISIDDSKKSTKELLVEVLKDIEDGEKGVLGNSKKLRMRLAEALCEYYDIPRNSLKLPNAQMKAKKKIVKNEKPGEKVSDPSQEQAILNAFSRYKQMPKEGFTAKTVYKIQLDAVIDLIKQKLKPSKTLSIN